MSAAVLESIRPSETFSGRAGLAAVIFDVDGVLLASPHERAWRDALDDLADHSRFTTDFYQEQVAGKPRLDGALAALVGLGVADPSSKAPAYAERKQSRLEALVEDGTVQAFPDALRLVRKLRTIGLPIAVASSSKNANRMMELIPFSAELSLLQVFDVNVCGRDLAHGKPDPEIFLLAASELHVPPARCLVAEDAPAGIEAARAGGMTAVGVARLHDGAGLRAAGAQLVVTSLDGVSVPELANGRLAGIEAVQ